MNVNFGGARGRVWKPLVATGQDPPQRRRTKVQRIRRAGQGRAGWRLAKGGVGLNAGQRGEGSERPPRGGGKGSGTEEAVPAGRERAAEEQQHLGRMKGPQG